MQHISIDLVDENNSVLETLKMQKGKDFVDVLGGAIWKMPNSKTEFPWISSIDPYGMTWLNLYQMEHFSRELTLLKDKVQERNIVEAIDTLLQFLTKVEQHVYLRFSGD
jgi:hypothetical protein